MVFAWKKHPEFPGNFPEKVLPGIFGICEIFPESFSEIFPDYSYLHKSKKIDFCSVKLRFNVKNISVFREFSGENFSGNFRNFGNFVKTSSKFSRDYL